MVSGINNYILHQIKTIFFCGLYNFPISRTKDDQLCPAGLAASIIPMGNRLHLMKKKRHCKWCRTYANKSKSFFFQLPIVSQEKNIDVNSVTEHYKHLIHVKKAKCITPDCNHVQFISIRIVQVVSNSFMVNQFNQTSASTHRQISIQALSSSLILLTMESVDLSDRTQLRLCRQINSSSLQIRTVCKNQDTKYLSVYFERNKKFHKICSRKQFAAAQSSK